MGQQARKYNMNTVRYTPKAALGLDMRLASMICWATFSTSTTPIISTRLVVLIMRVMRLMERGMRRRTVWGRTTQKKVCRPVRPSAAADSY